MLRAGVDLKDALCKKFAELRLSAGLHLVLYCVSTRGGFDENRNFCKSRCSWRAPVLIGD